MEHRTHICRLLRSPQRSPEAEDLASSILENSGAVMLGAPKAVAYARGWLVAALPCGSSSDWTLDGNVIGYRWTNANPRERDLLIAHGIAAAELCRAGIVDTLALTVWLAASLWLPVDVVAALPRLEALRAQPVLPSWWVNARILGAVGAGVRPRAERLHSKPS